MKKLLFICLFSLLTTLLTAQVSKSINVTSAGTLATLLTASEKTTVTNLTITGIIDVRDFVTMSNSIIHLDTLDMSNATITAYSGSGGTKGQNGNAYPANELPSYSFMNTVLTNGGSLPLKNIELPTSLTSIASGAFSGCISLINIAIPNSVTNIAEDAFSYCIGLKEFIVQADNPKFTVKDGVLFNKNQTVLLRYPAGKTGEYSIPPTVTNIGNSSFTDSKNMSGILIGNTVTFIGTNAFSGCTGLTNVVIPNSVTSLGAYSFYCCFGLTSVSIPNTITSIDSGTFYYCNKLSTLSIPNSVTSLGILSFYACESLTNVTIPNAVTTIKHQAFYSCSNLTSVTLGSSVSSLDSLAFQTCNKMVEFIVQSDNTVFSATDGVLFNKDKTALIQFPKGKQGAYSIPNTVTLISNLAFSNSKGLTGITIPNSVITIGNHAFEYCTALSSLTIGNSVTSIGDYAFPSCFLFSITIPNSVTSIGSHCFDNCFHVSSLSIGSAVKTIGDYAFSNCSMTTIIIPNSVTSIGNFAFNYCSGVTTLTIPQNISWIGNSAFSNCSLLTSIYAYPVNPVDLSSVSNVFSGQNNITLHVPMGSKLLYQAAIQWKDFTNIVEIPSAVPTLSDTKIKIYTSGLSLIVDGISEGEIVTIYKANGKQIQTIKSTGERLNLPVDRDGVYLVKIGKNTFKVIL